MQTGYKDNEEVKALLLHFYDYTVKFKPVEKDKRKPHAFLPMTLTLMQSTALHKFKALCSVTLEQ